MTTFLPPPVSARATSKRRLFSNHARHAWDYFCLRLSAPPPTESIDAPPEDSGGSVTTRKVDSDDFPEDDDGGIVDAVVVDNKGFRIYNIPAQSAKSTHSNHDASLKSHTGSLVDLEHSSSAVRSHASARIGAIRRLIYGCWPAFTKFANLSEYHDTLEEQFWREKWFASKRFSLIGGLWVVSNWVFAVSFARRPFNLFDEIYFYLVSPLLVLPLPFMVVADLPKGGRSLFYQVWLALAVWNFALFSVLDMYLCGFFSGHSVVTCVDPDFLNLLYYSCALPAIALFALHQNRIPATISVIIFLALELGMIVPHRIIFIQHILEVGVFYAFLLYLHYRLEDSNRRVFSLKEQIKLQYRETQKAQFAERKSADSKRRLTNYIFHEVRVPLNVATLAFQNLDASGMIANENSFDFSALGSSLKMMSKVLSDILDFNRMDAGRLICVDNPYNLHKAMQGWLLGAFIAGDARGIQIVVDLDDRVDLVARYAMYLEQGMSDQDIQKRLREKLDDALMVGDELRLRQVLTNIMSNALKFSIPGPESKIIVRSRLILPLDGDVYSKACRNDASGVGQDKSIGSGTVNQQDSPKLEALVVRFEIEDNGVGINPKDMAGHRLFSPYVQTEIGRTQGGKGTGLGLALVRHIVALSGGRLGVVSKRGVGSTFWVEVPFGIGARALRARSYSNITVNGSPLFDHNWNPLRHPSSLRSTQNSSTVKGTDGSQTPSTLTPSMSFKAPPEYLDGLAHSGADLVPVILPPNSDTSDSSGSPSTEVSKLPVAASIPQSVPEEHVLSLIMEDPPPAILASERSHPPPNRRNSPLSIPAPSTQCHITFGAAGATLARSTSSDPPKTSSTSGTATKIGENMNILVVDDDNLTRRLMSRMLQRLGCEVVTAEDGRVALFMLLTGEKVSPATLAGLAGPPMPGDAPRAESTVMQHEHRFHIIFLDNQMPRLSGVEMTKRLRAYGRKDIVVGVTGNALAEDQREYLDAGADYVLTKPVREQDLKEMLALARTRLASSPSAMPTPVTPEEKPPPLP